MKLDVKNLNNKELRDFIDDGELLYEEEVLEKRDAKNRKKKIQHKNTRRMMKRWRKLFYL